MGKLSVVPLWRDDTRKMPDTPEVSFNEASLLCAMPALLAPISPALDFEEEKQELEWLLRYPEISRSTSLVRFLNFVCHKYFEGKAKEIREYTVAVEALGRKESNFDSHADPIVRVTARNLRKKLSEIYAGDGQDHTLHIELPLGHYVPQFVRRKELIPPDGVRSHEEGEGPTQACAAGLFKTERKTSRRIVPLLLTASGLFLAGYLLGQNSQH